MTATELKLYEISDRLRVVVDELMENGGELTDDLRAELDTWQGAFAEKVERVLLYARNLGVLADAAYEESVRIKQLAESRHRAADRLRDYVLHAMQATRTPKVETPLIIARVTKNSRPSIRWQGEPETIPEAFRRVRVEVDGSAAYAHWRQHQTLPEGFAVVQSYHLRVR